MGFALRAGCVALVLRWNWVALALRSGGSKASERRFGTVAMAEASIDEERERRVGRRPGVRIIGATALVAAIAAAMSALANPVSLRIDGQRMVSDVPPVTTPKGAYVPLRVVAESLGATANYDAKTGVIELMRANDTMRLHVGDRVATLNGNKMTLHTAPFSVSGRTMVPLGTIARAFGTRVTYDRARAKIDVIEPGVDVPGGDDTSP